LPVDLRRNPLGSHHARASLPVNLKVIFRLQDLVAREADIDRLRDLARMPRPNPAGVPFGERTMADAMYAPVVTRFLTYDVKLSRMSAYAQVSSWRCRDAENGSRLPKPGLPISKELGLNIRQRARPPLFARLKYRASFASFRAIQGAIMTRGWARFVWAKATDLWCRPAVHQRPGIVHYLFDYSPDMEYLEIVSRLISRPSTCHPAPTRCRR
jgi:hypothetical protein